MRQRLNTLVVLLIITLVQYAAAKESSAYNIGTRSELLSAPASPDCSTGCDEIVASSKINKDYNLKLDQASIYGVTSDFSKLKVTVASDGATLRICGNVTIKSLNFWGNKILNIEITSGSTLNLNLSTWNPNITVTNWGTYSGSYASSGVLTNYGTVNATNFYVYSGGSVTNDGILNISRDAYIYSDATLTNSGTLDVSRSLTSNGTLTNDGDLNVSRDFDSNGTTTNTGTLDVTRDVSVTGTLTNDGTLDVNRSLYTGWDSNIDNNSTITVDKSFVNNNDLDNSGDITVTGSITNSWGSETTNSGSISTGNDYTQLGTLTSSGDIIVDDTFSDWWGTTTVLEDGAYLETTNLTLYSSITGTGDYSTVYVKEESDLNSSSTIAGSITYYDADGVESSDGTIEDSVQDLNDSNKLITLNGSDQYLKVTDHNELDIQANGTVEAMINLTSYQPYAGIVHKGSTPDWSEANNGLASDEAYFMQLGGDGLPAGQNQIMFGVVDESYNYAIVSSSLQLELGKWYHVVASWNSETLSLYINGILQEEVSLTITPRATDGDLVIGSQTPEVSGSPNYYPFDGSIDNIRIWNKSFTSEEIWSDFGTSYDTAQDSLVFNLTFETLNSDWQGNYYLSVSSTEHEAFLYNVTGDGSSATSTEDIFENNSALIEAGISKEYEYFIVETGQSLVATTDFSCNNLIINANSSIYIPDSVTITINEDLYVKSNAGGYGQILLEGNMIIAGGVHVEHAFKGNGVWQFLTVPTTVTDFSIFGTTFDVDYAIFYYDETKRAQNGHTSSVWSIPTQLDPGTGYIFAFAEPKSVIFDITPAEYFDTNNGAISLNYTSASNELDAGWNLVGNPFQSVVSWDKVIEAAENDVFNSGGAGAAIYFYDNATGNYQSYVSGAATNGLDGTINPMDAFFMKALSDGSQFSIKRSFFPNTLITKSSSLNKEKLLKATLSNINSKDETIIRFNEEASDYTDEEYDAYKEFGDNSLCQVYTNALDDASLSINTLPEFKDTQLELFTKCPTTGSYTLSFENIESFANEDIYLIDKKEGIIINLEDEQEYTFTSETSGNLNRFLIVTKSEQLTTLVNPNEAPTPFYYYNGKIRLLDTSLSGEVCIYNTLGQKVYTTYANSNNIDLPVDFAPGVYIISIADTNEQIIIR